MHHETSPKVCLDGAKSTAGDLEGPEVAGLVSGGGGGVSDPIELVDNFASIERYTTSNVSLI